MKDAKEKCVSCGAETSLVCASSIAPVTLPYCRKCQEKGAEPWSLVKLVGKRNNWKFSDWILNNITIYKEGKYINLRTKIKD